MQHAFSSVSQALSENKNNTKHVYSKDFLYDQAVTMYNRKKPTAIFIYIAAF